MIELSSPVTDAMLREELIAERALLDGLTRIGPLLTSELDSERLMQRLTEEATRMVGADFGAFFYNVVEPAGESYMLYTLAGAPREAFERFGMPRNTAVFAPTFAGEGTVCSDDITQDPRFGKNAPHHGMPKGHLPVVSYLAVPVRDVSGAILGGLFFGHAARAKFGARQARAAEAISAMAAPALANAKLFRELEASQTALRDANTRYELVNDATREGLWFWDVVTNSVDWNDALLQSMGMQREQWKGTFDEWFARLHPDDQPRLREALRAHLEQRVPYQVEQFRLRHASGEFRWFATVGQAAWDDSGHPTRMAGSVRDITDRKRAEDARAASELRFRQILDSIDDQIFCKDENLNVSYANAATLRYYGTASAEAWRDTRDPLADIDAASQHDADAREVFALGRPLERAEEPRCAPNGEVRFFHTIRTPIFDASGKVVELVGVSRDVTERKRAFDEQRSLAEAATILARSIDYDQTLDNVARAMVPVVADWCAIDILEDGKLRRVAVAHSDPRKVELALQLERRYPTPVDSTTGVPAVLRSGRPELVERIPTELLQQLARDDEHLRLIQELALNSYVVVPMLAHSQVLGAISLVGEGERSLGQRELAFAEKLAKRAGAALENALLYREVRQLNETLEARVDERTTSLLEANRELEAFSYTVSHDLRAPIRHVSGFVDMLQKHAGASLDHKSLHYLTTIKQASAQMGTLIDSLLSFSRLGRAELSKRPVALGSLVEAVVGELGPDLADRTVTWSIGSLPTVSADAVMLRLVLSNLLANAVKYTKQKSHAHIEVGADTRGREHLIWIKDDGAGFNMAYKDKLFGVFQRLHSDKEFAGTGIGLATARRVVNRHGGRIWAESELGSGATFYFTLPRLEPSHD